MYICESPLEILQLVYCRMVNISLKEIYGRIASPRQWRMGCSWVTEWYWYIISQGPGKSSNTSPFTTHYFWVQEYVTSISWLPNNVKIYPCAPRSFQTQVNCILMTSLIQMIYSVISTIVIFVHFVSLLLVN